MKSHRIVPCRLCVCATAFADEPFDVLIRNGQLVDGTGNPWVQADVAIRVDRIVAIGNLRDTTAKTVIEAKGKIVAPGFIDLHSQNTRRESNTSSSTAKSSS